MLSTLYQGTIVQACLTWSWDSTGPPRSNATQMNTVKYTILIGLWLAKQCKCNKIYEENQNKRQYLINQKKLSLVMSVVTYTFLKCILYFHNFTNTRSDWFRSIQTRILSVMVSSGHMNKSLPFTYRSTTFNKGRQATRRNVVVDGGSHFRLSILYWVWAKKAL